MIRVCSLFSGSSGNCIFVSVNNIKILIDAGLSGIKIIEALKSIGQKPEELDAILVSHEHSDHVKGAGILSRKLDIPIYANKGTWEGMEGLLGKVSQENKKYFVTGKPFEIGDLDIKPFSIPHDASEPVGYNFIYKNKKITIATDLGHMNNTLLSSLLGSDLILLESNHNVEMLKMGKYPWYLKQRILGENGHLCNDMAAKTATYLVENGTRTVILGHLSQENNIPELAYETVCNVMRLKGIEVGKDVALSVASRTRVGKVYEI